MAIRPHNSAKKPVKLGIRWHRKHAVRVGDTGHGEASDQHAYGGGKEPPCLSETHIP